jgi:RNA polymerase sigma-19 factor, ECF subfamily
LEEQFKAVYFQYYGALVNFARFYCTDNDEASSAVQQVFLNVWEKRDELLKKRDLKSYLYTSVRNRVFNAKRRKHIGYELESSAIDPSAGIHEKMEAEELELQIKKVIKRLPDRCRYIFELSRIENMSYAEIATQLDLSIKTIENQIGKALKILRMKIYGPDNQ